MAKTRQLPPLRRRACSYIALARTMAISSLLRAHSSLPSSQPILFWPHAAVDFAMVADVSLGKEEQSDGTHVFSVSLISSCPFLSSHRHSLSE